MKNRKEILYVGYRDNSHSSAGGYDGIIGNPKADCLMGENVPFGFIPVSQRGKFINLVFLDIISRYKRWNYRVTHFFYGDTISIPYCKSKKHKTVATIHLDINDTRRNRNAFLRSLKSLDGIIVLSSNQQRLLKEKFGLSSIFIPHGFNKPVFEPIDSGLDQKKINICVLGQNYRDFETMEHIINHCGKNRPDVIFHLIGQPQRIKDKYSNYDNVIVYNRIPDNEYYSIISSCDYNFLPLTFATANNALLEAGFLGVKSILPKISGVEDYGAPSPLNIYYSDTKEAELVFDNLKKCGRCKELENFCEEHFLWDKIYDKLNDYYSTL